MGGFNPFEFKSINSVVITETWSSAKFTGKGLLVKTSTIGYPTEIDGQTLSNNCSGPGFYFFNEYIKIETGGTVGYFLGVIYYYD